MGVEFIRIIRERLGWTRYRLAREVGEATQTIDHAEEKGVSIRPALLCKIRKCSGLSWKQFGELLDAEYMED